MSAQPIGYRYAVYGDEMSDLVPVSELDDDEKLIIALRAQAKEQWTALSQKKHKDGLKPTEIGKLAELNAILEQLNSECRHRVFNDAPGFMYSVRSCAICGHSMGLI